MKNKKALINRLVISICLIVMILLSFTPDSFIYSLMDRGAIRYIGYMLSYIKEYIIFIMCWISMYELILMYLEDKRISKWWLYSILAFIGTFIIALALESIGYDIWLCVVLIMITIALLFREIAITAGKKKNKNKEKD